MSLGQSLVDTWLVARFELLRAVRTWRAVAVILAFVIAELGASWIFIEVLSEVENEIARTLGVATTRWPGALMSEIKQSDRLVRIVGDLVGDDILVTQLLEWPLLAIFHLWLGFGLLPFLAATTASESIAADVGTRTLRFEALRTGRAELVAGRTLGQALLVLLAAFAGIFATWCLGMSLMVEQDPVALATGLLALGGRAVAFGLPFVGVGIAFSQLTTSPMWARVMSLVAVAGSWVLYGVLNTVESAPWTQIADLTLPLFPQTWLQGFWRTGGDLWTSMAVCSALCLAVAGLGFVRFSHRDL